MDRHAIAAILEEIGLLLELKGESPFKSNAYYNAARTIESITEDLHGRCVRLVGLRTGEHPAAWRDQLLPKKFAGEPG